MSPEEAVIRRADMVLRESLRRRRLPPPLVDDLSQAALLKLLSYRRKKGALPPAVYNIELLGRSYVEQMGRNEYYSWSRRQGRRKEEELGSEFDAASRENDPAETAVENERSLLLHSAVSALPPSFRDVTRLHLEGRTEEQIAQEEGLPLGTVKSRLSRAKAKLKRHLTKKLDI